MARQEMYLMESPEEELRLELKTDPEAVKQEARWCGISPGMKIIHAGCGPGLVSSVLYEMVDPAGFVMGVDYSENRISYAREHYWRRGKIEFVLCDLRQPLPFGQDFDLAWVRFLLEYNKSHVNQIVQNLDRVLRPGGLLCLLDLDNNCLVHYPLPDPLKVALGKIMVALERRHDFDPYVGRKLYALLYDLGYENIHVALKAHHLIYGQVRQQDFFNWMKKVEMVLRKEPSIIGQYPGGPSAFLADFNDFFSDPRRFTYTPMIMCKGTKPL